MVEENTGQVTDAVDLLFASLLPLEGELTAEPLFSLMEHQVPGLKIARAGGDSHFTAEGVLQGFPFFFRCRRGTAVLLVGENPVERPLYQSETKFTPTGPELSSEEFSKVFLSLVPKLGRAPFLFEFSGRGVEISGKLNELAISATEEEELFRSWGQSAEDAFRKIAEPSNELAKIGLPTALQGEIFSLQEVDAQPLNEDTRVFPNPEPAFRVLS